MLNPRKTIKFGVLPPAWGWKIGTFKLGHKEKGHKKLIMEKANFEAALACNFFMHSTFSPFVTLCN